ncbi:hypothetical protein FIBSPDRAFT_885216 [Athelia psychrophila]|uniref:Uncharacterized protein n=1 Tax=Athelia psychrophila TaxID=1759441 RepID=A0A166S821_9AGAM|nr:hypothetical protein FIBSPDRAFT_885216 [Fibularhizoctonia sp. CBS 109695]
MAHFAIPLVNFNINTIDIVIVPCQFLPSPIRTHPCASIPRKRMPRRPRILSFPGAVVAFCKSLRLPSATNRYPRHAARRTLVPSPTQVKTADMEVDDSVFAHKGHSLDTVDHKLSPEANVASSSSLSELQARSKSPLSLISCPILEHWNSSALEHSSRAKTTEPPLSDEESIYALDGDERHSIGHSVTLAASSQSLPRPRSASPEPDLGFLPLSPPPSHFRARRENAWRYAELDVAPRQSEDGPRYWPRHLRLPYHFLYAFCVINPHLALIDKWEIRETAVQIHSADS